MMEEIPLASPELFTVKQTTNCQLHFGQVSIDSQPSTSEIDATLMHTTAQTQAECTKLICAYVVKPTRRLQSHMLSTVTVSSEAGCVAA